jgi:hypothetical protein
MNRLFRRRGGHCSRQTGSSENGVELWQADRKVTTLTRKIRVILQPIPAARRFAKRW